MHQRGQFRGQLGTGKIGRAPGGPDQLFLGLGAIQPGDDRGGPGGVVAGDGDLPADAVRIRREGFRDRGGVTLLVGHRAEEREDSGFPGRHPGCTSLAKPLEDGVAGNRPGDRVFLANLHVGDPAIFAETDGDAVGFDRVGRLEDFRGLDLADQHRFGPVGVIAGDAVAGIGDQQFQFGDPFDRDIDLLCRVAHPHDAAVEQHLAIAKHLEDDAGLGGFGMVLEVVVDADPGGKGFGLAFEIIGNLAAGMGAEPVGEGLAGDGHRGAGDPLVDLQGSPGLAVGGRRQVAQPGLPHVSGDDAQGTAGDQAE